MRTGRAGCGLRYAVKKGGSAVSYCAISIKCGTRDESGYNAGIAHFIEHTIFKGTVRKSAKVINSYLDRLGGELNAYTTKEEIVLHATVLKEDLPKAAELLFELVTDSIFPENEIMTEKGVVIDEINSYKDSPSEDIYDKFEEMLFSGHALSVPILGTASSVKKIKREEIQKFIREKFTPDRMAFSVVADISEEKMEKLVEKLAGKWFGQEPSVGDDIIPERYTDTAKFDKTVNKKNHQANYILGGAAPSLYDEKERIAAIVLCNILGGPATNSILNAELREKRGLVYGVECSYTQYSDCGIVTICLGCDKENLEKCDALIRKEISGLRTNPLSPARLKAAKKQFLGQMVINSDSGEAQCLSMGKSLLAYGRINTEQEAVAKIEAVSAEDIRAAAAGIFSDGNLSRLIFL